MKKISTTLLILLLVFIVDGITTTPHVEQDEAQASEPGEVVVEHKPEPDIREFIAQTMAIVRPRMSDVKRTIVIETLSRVAETYLETSEHRELWIAMIATESAFNTEAKSSAGAIGIGQVMPASAEWYGQKCSLNGITEKDLYDLQVNALVSVCVFKQILKKVNGRSSLLMVAYNAGAYSKDVKRIDELKSINTESANYVAKIFTLMEKTKEKIATSRD
jgi:membrane-bound lytic murein transglycosylase B